MSKLSNMIEAHQTGRVRLMPTSPFPVIMVEEDDIIRHDWPLAKREYYLGVRLRVKGYADSEHGAEMVHLKEMCKRQILDEVFGEFRPLVRRLERAIYEMNFDAAHKVLADLANEMGF